MTADELAAAGLYDPAAPEAAQRLEVLQFLAGLGATIDDLTEFSDDLPALASVVALRGGRTLTLAEVSEQSGVAAERVVAITRAAGFPTPEEGASVYSEGFVDLAASMTAAEELFGSETVLQLVRVMGAATSRLADAIVSAFLVNIEPAARQQDNVALGIARANAEAVSMLPIVTAGLDVLLRQHLIATRRTMFGKEYESGFEIQHLCVGFANLVGSTEVSEQLTTRELGAVLTEFEHLAADTVTERGGRMIKLIGDEVLFTAPDEVTAGAIAIELSALLRAHPRVPSARIGLASGEVMLRDGDVFGPIVNLAARAVNMAGPNEVVVPAALAKAADLTSESIGSYDLKGFADPVELHRITPAASPEPAG